MKGVIRLKLLIACLVLGFALTGGACAQPNEGTHPLAGKKAAEGVLKDSEGGTQMLRTIIQDKKAILFFWTTWCPHCRSQIREFSGRKDEMAKENIKVVLIDIGEKPTKVLSFMKTQAVDMPVFFDTDGAVSEAYMVLGIPTMVFVGADGVIRDVVNGFPDDYKDLLK